MNTVLICALLGLPLTLSPQTPDSAEEVTQESTSDIASDLFDTLEEEAETIYDNWLSDYRMKMQEAEENGSDMPMMSMVPPLGPVLAKFQKAATDYAGTEAAVQFLTWIAQSGMQIDQDAAIAAFVTLFETHTRSEGLEDLVESFPYLTEVLGQERGTRYLAKVEADSPVADIRDWAAFARLSPILDSSALDSEAFIAAKAEFKQIIERTESRRLRGQMEFKVRIIEQFGLGMVAPDIVGVDLDGVEFKLSDYKGKILFVDFWGDW